MKVGIVSLGCPKNQVDAEVMVGILKRAGHVVTTDEREAEAVFVNTCTFIREAKEESIDAILEVAQLKGAGRLRRLIVTGCMAQRYCSELINELPEVDAYLGTDEFGRVAELLAELEAGDAVRVCRDVPFPVNVYTHDTPRHRFTPAHWGYIKIAEGCDNKCSYCVIPAVRGDLRSRPKSSIIQEARIMASEGVREICVIAQDTTAYGADRKRGADITSLLSGLAHIRGIDWVRLMYAHPAHVTDSLLELMAAEEKLASYIDLPIQHISDAMLKKMGRRVDGKTVRKVVERIRKKVPDVAIRTSVIVGFPGETKQMFSELLAFVKEARFDHLGVFRYSAEEDTPAALMEPKVSDELATERHERVMKAQMKISTEINRAKLGKTYKVIVDGASSESEHLLEGRAYFQAPDIDGVVYINEGEANPGELVDVEITGAHPYDLVGRVAGS